MGIGKYDRHKKITGKGLIIKVLLLSGERNARDHTCINGIFQVLYSYVSSVCGSTNNIPAFR